MCWCARWWKPISIAAAVFVPRTRRWEPNDRNAPMNARDSFGVPPIRLGINIDHIATLRDARGGRRPDPVRAARLVVEAGGGKITSGLRQDRRPIRAAGRIR